MPIYEYQCQDCQHQLEALQKISELPLVDCPSCGKPGLKKLVSAAAFKLKGSGWYETDFKNTGSSGKPAKDSGSDSSATKDSGSSDKASSSSASSS